MRSAQEHASAHDYWYYVVGDKHIGPVTSDNLLAALNSGELDGRTLVWREGLSSWVQADACTPLQSRLKEPDVSLTPPLVNEGPGKQVPPLPTPPPAFATTPIEYAGLHWRLLAGIIDFAVMIVPVYLIQAVAAAAFGASQPVELLSVILVWGCYYAVLHSSKWQATVGMKILKLRIMDRDGKRISFGRAAVRYFASLLSSALCYLGFLSIPFTPKKQGFHDQVVGTIVVKSG